MQHLDDRQHSSTRYQNVQSIDQRIEFVRLVRIHELFRLAEEGLLSETEETAVKRVIAYQLTQFMQENELSKTAMAKRMQTSRSALDRLLDPANPSVTLQTMDRAARALGKKLRIELT